MPKIKIMCKNCETSFLYDDEKEYGFCTYCGSKVIIQSKVSINTDLSTPFSINKDSLSHNSTITENRNPTADESLVEYGYILLEKGKNSGSYDIDEILEKFRRALDINPRNKLAWDGINECANLLVKFGYSWLESNPNKAEQYFEWALSIDNNKYKAWLGMFEYYKKYSISKEDYGYVGIYYIEYNETYSGSYSTYSFSLTEHTPAKNALNNAFRHAPENEKEKIRRLIVDNIDNAYSKALQLKAQVDSKHPMNKRRKYMGS